MGFRADSATRAAIVRWAENQPDMPSLSEAIRRLVELGLASATKAPARRSEKSATKAKELAANAIDRLRDSSARPEEQANRKRRLLKGPEEFQDVRVDRPKKK
ncbi:hypothetical protein CQ13_29760 [Bradyrhizobium retamae]|uniref:Uncharacterized protein n=2 Tax=Bradyrhizobium retamae TaxID=1300035 RepID=A0A0R3MW73_9BRAD|nr:hypothetical protein CQ13_29760 [Bradyrhizobium retamae]